MALRCLVGLAFLAAVIGLAPFQTIRGGGSLPVTVVVVSSSGSPISSVTCETFSSPESAAYSLEHLLPPETRQRSVTADPFDGSPLVVEIPAGERIDSALLWSHSRRFQFQSLLVIADYEDGRRDGRLAALPDLRATKAIRVELP